MFQKYPKNFAFQLCSNLPVKFTIFLKISLPFNSFYCLLFIRKTLWLNNLKARTVMDAIFAEAIIYLVLYDLHDCTYKNTYFIEHLRTAVFVFLEKFLHASN